MPGRTDDFRPSPGFQGSETTGVEVVIYHQGADPIIFTGGTTEFGRIIRTTKGKVEAAIPSLTAVQTFKALGSAAGTFALTAKSPRPNPTFVDLFDDLVDDDWIDIVFTRHGRKWHVMRGLLDDVRRSTSVSGTGATTTVFNITGRDFGKVWQQTPIWFSIYMRAAINGHLAAKVWTASRPDTLSTAVRQDSAEFQSPMAAVRGYLFGFLEELGGVGRENWNPPGSVPGITDGSFVKSLFFNNVGFSNVPERKALDPNFRTATGMLWDLAQEWSDPLFTEMYVDLMPSNQTILQGIELPIDETTMTVMYRDKPFPFSTNSGEISLPKGSDSAWFNLPLFIIPRETIKNINIGRGGAERFNTFLVVPALQQETIGKLSELVQPLWNKNDILAHGMRKFDVASKYYALGANLITLTSAQREMIRDWYAMNPYLYNGTIELGMGMPDIKIGVRARIPGATTEDHDETFYVESVGHNWAFGGGLKTTLGVTRGWRGKDESLIDAMDSLVSEYEVEPRE